MKFSILLSIAALMATTAANHQDVSGSAGLDISSADSSAIFGDSSVPSKTNSDEGIINVPQNDVSAGEGSGVHSSHGKSSRVIVWSSPGYKGHKQVAKGTRGCYRLDGGAVGSFEGGLKSSKYGFFNDDRCKGRQLYGWSSAPVHRIDPIIYPRSLKIYENGGGPEPTRYSLVAWSESSFTGDRQLITGMGCQSLSGNTIRSFQGEFKYKFFAEPYCYGRKALESDGGKSTVRRMNPRSAYIY